MNMPRVFKDILTDNTNENYDWIPSLAAFGVLAFIIYTGVAMALGQPWEPLNYGTGMAAVLAAAGGAQRMRDGMPSSPLPPAHDK